MKRLLAGLALVGTVAVSGASAAPAWSPTAVPVDHGDITAIDALSDSEAYAVGYRLTGLQAVEQVALRWDGSAWTQHSLLPTGAFAAALEVRSANDIWIAGSGTAHWDGTAWTNRPLAQSPKGRHVPDAIASAPDGKVWVAGRATRMSIKDAVPAIQSWNGTSWQDETLPDVGAGELTSLAVLGADDVWAAGSVFGEVQRTLVLHWDGVSWQRIETPAAANPTWLGGLTALGSKDVWAVGGSYGSAGDVPFAMHWDGLKWTVTRTPAVPDGRLRGVGRTGNGQVWAVGGKGGAGVALRWEPRLRNWVRVAAPDLVVRGFSTVPSSSALWTVGVAKRGDLVPAIRTFRSR